MVPAAQGTSTTESLTIWTGALESTGLGHTQTPRVRRETVVSASLFTNSDPTQAQTVVRPCLWVGVDMVRQQARHGIHLDPDELPPLSPMPEAPEAWQGDTAPFRSTWLPAALGRKCVLSGLWWKTASWEILGGNQPGSSDWKGGLGKGEQQVCRDSGVCSGILREDLQSGGHLTTIL